MNTDRLQANELRSMGYRNAEVIEVAMRVMTKHYRGVPKERRILLLKDILINPMIYLRDEELNPIANGVVGANWKATP